ncbi:hypothetical protein GJV06_11610 [Enterobacteriaceae bacterium RIT691]|nr:hypothetical protein [Enterobacteriaceae bacterium RIT691]
MLDSVQVEEASASPAASPEPESDYVADKSPSLLKKAVLNAAIDHLASSPVPGLPEPDSSPATRTVQPPQPSVVPQYPDEQPKAPFVPYEPVVSTAPDAPCGSPAPARQRSEQQVTPAPRRKNATNNASPAPRSSLVANRRLSATARPVSLPTQRLATLLADEEQTMFSSPVPAFVRDTPRVKTVLSQPEEVKKTRAEDKPGTSLLSLTQKLLKGVGEETSAAARTSEDPRTLTKQEPGERRGEGSVLVRRGRIAEEQTSKETQKGDIRIDADANNSASPLWHPFTASSADLRQAFTPGWLSVAVVVLLATLLIILLQILNL